MKWGFFRLIGQEKGLKLRSDVNGNLKKKKPF